MDQYGRLNRAELREAVRRRVDTLRAAIDAVGNETGVQQLDPLVSNQDINLMLNTNLIKRSVDVNVADNTIMADSVVIDVLTGQTEYPLPVDLMFLRAVYWKPDFLTIIPIPPGQRIFMYESDSDGDIDAPLIQGLGVPSFRRRLNTIVLNQVPQINNSGGLEIDYTKNFLALSADDQYIETPLSQIIQEVVILDTVIEITTERMKIDGTELRQTLSGLEQRLTLAVTNYHAPKTIRMVPTTVMARPPYGRRIWSWGNGGRNWWSWG